MSDDSNDFAPEVRLTGSLGLRSYEPGFSEWLAVRLLSHGETYLRRKRHLARCVQVYREERTERRARQVENATEALRRAEKKLERSLWRLRQEIEHEEKRT